MTVTIGKRVYTVRHKEPPKEKLKRLLKELVMKQLEEELKREKILPNKNGT